MWLLLTSLTQCLFLIRATPVCLANVRLKGFLQDHTQETKEISGLGWSGQNLFRRCSYSSLYSQTNGLSTLLNCTSPFRIRSKVGFLQLECSYSQGYRLLNPVPFRPQKVSPSVFLNEETTTICPKRKLFNNLISKFERLKWIIWDSLVPPIVP